MAIKNPTRFYHRYFIPVSIGAVASTFYLYDFLARVMPAAMTNELLQAFQIHADKLGILASMFFWGYALMQIPAGYLCDRFSTRKILALMLFICAIATILFSISSNIWLAGLARFIMGFTSAFAYIGALRIGINWFPAKRFAMYTGLVQILGCAGAVIGSGPIAALTQSYSWQTAAFIIAMIGLGLAALNWLVLRDHPKGVIVKTKMASAADGRKLIRKVLMNPQQWWAATYGFAIWAPIEIFAAIWGTPFLAQVYNISIPLAASMLSTIWAGVALGGPVAGWYSNHIHLRKLPMALGAVVGIISSCVLIYLQPPYWLAIVCLFFFGVASSCMVLSFGLTSDINSKEHIGTAVGFTNMAIIFGAIILQPIVGFVLVHLWQGTTIGTTPLYTIHAYQTGLTLIPLCYALALAVTLTLVRETHCKSIIAIR